MFLPPPPPPPPSPAPPPAAPGAFDAFFGAVFGAVHGVEGAIHATENQIGGAAHNAGDALTGAEHWTEEWARHTYVRGKEIYDDWGTIALAWIIVGYITIIVMVILAEATRAAMGLAAFGAEGSDSDFGYDELYDETSYIEPSKAAAPPTLGAKPKPGADKKDDEELNRSKSSSFVGQVQSAVL